MKPALSQQTWLYGRQYKLYDAFGVSAPHKLLYKLILLSVTDYTSSTSFAYREKIIINNLLIPDETVPW